MSGSIFCSTAHLVCRPSKVTPWVLTYSSNQASDRSLRNGKSSMASTRMRPMALEKLSCRLPLPSYFTGVSTRASLPAWFDRSRSKSSVVSLFTITTSPLANLCKPLSPSTLSLPFISTSV